jgi:hypothetical protein
MTANNSIDPALLVTERQVSPPRQHVHGNHRCGQRNKPYSP